MSTIASPRDPSGSFPRRTNSQAITPNSSARPSLDVSASAASSPNTSAQSLAATSQNKRASRAALREYYNIRTTTTNNKPLPSTPTPTVEITADTPSQATAPSPLDDPSFDAAAYVAELLATCTLAELLRLHARLLSEMRALDAEKKALVYDNYSKLIAATETIRRMRAATTAAQHPDLAAPDGGHGHGRGRLEEVVEGIYRQAEGLREALRAQVSGKGTGQGSGGGAGDGDGNADWERIRRRERTRELAREVLRVPGRLRKLVEEGKIEEAKREWELPRRLLVRWRERGLGGRDVQVLIEEGDAVLRGAAGEGEANATSSAAAGTTT